MFTVIAHDFQSDFFYGSKDFASLEEARAWAALQTQEVPPDVDVFIQDPDGQEITHTADA